MRANRKGRIVLALLGLAAFVACALVVLGPRSVAGPQTASATCCSKRTILANAASQGTNPAAGTHAQPVDPPGTVEGAKNPELIPDEVAYKMLFLSIMEPDNATDAQKARQEAKLRMIGLSDDDKAGFLARLGDFRDRLSDLAGRTQEILKATPKPARGSAEWQELSDIEQQTNTVVTDTVEALHTGLTQDGLAKLQAHLLRFKHTIKAFPMPDAGSDQ